MEHYDLGEKPGYYIVFNHEYFSEDFPSGAPDPRKGTNRDVTVIKETFNKLGFESHKTVRNSSKQLIFNKLKEVFSRDFTNFGSIFVFILTHGTEGYTLSAYDTTYTLDQLLDHAMQHASPTLKGKPKVFVIQACNGPKVDRSTEWAAAAANSASEKNYSAHPFLMPVVPDVLLAFASPPGYLSLRNWFIPILCKSVQQYAYNGCSYDVVKLLTSARRRVADDDDGGRDRKGPRKQVTLTISTLTKSFNSNHAAADLIKKLTQRNDRQHSKSFM